ncbi:ribonucleases P/MRP protein subunit POP1 [Engraulis encrasicolus]|uniref:ribonucleases P/MRP protein subunit POP1 n=1 Tax=Engraulis encrasicolus TaxID=184585 RepID=UPI002FD3AFF1
MSAAKSRMRNKHMRDQPSNVTYSSGGWRNGGEGRPPGDSQPGKRQGFGNHGGGWVRGHQPGGSTYPQELPKYITSTYFAKARAAEVKAMLRAVNKTTGSCHTFGALPKHMRRRAMSHDTKRLPKRLREGAQRMLDKSLQMGKKEESKTKSRKARRRHGNLLLEFNRRQRKNVWLETHIWHAKRFHMVKKWGYCLGERPTLKCYRACYRAMSSHCLLQDLSYYCCLELQGPEDQLLSALSRLTSKDAGPTFAAVLCLSGRRQGSVVLYRADQYPSQPLGPVLFLWRPRTQGSTHRQLWIWGHPSLKQDVLSELQAVCQCTEAVVPPTVIAVPLPELKQESEEPSPVAAAPLVSTPTQAKGRKRKRAEKDPGAQSAKKILGDGTRSPTCPITWKSASTEIVINDLTMEMVRYRLIGPLSHSVLAQTLYPATDCNEEAKSGQSCFWWPEHCKQEQNMALHREQSDLFQLLKGVFSTTEIPAGTVLGLTVDDPRIFLPRHRGYAQPDLQQAIGVDEEKRRALTLQGAPEHCCQSALWERSVRDNVTDNKMSEQELNGKRREVLVPGSRLSPTPLQGRVPLLLVHQPGKQLGQEMGSWGAGWDLLMPKGWGMAFWVPLVYRGVRVAGLKMSVKHSQFKGVPHFPNDYPDCPAGARFQDEQEAELLDKFTRRPPAKRANYIKHGCLAPFRCPWQQLVEEWAEIVKEEPAERRDGGQDGTEMAAVVGPSRFSVLRSRKVLRQLSAWCQPTSSRGQRLHQRGRGGVTHQAIPPQAPLTPAAAASLRAAHGHHSLVWARFSLLSKGRPELHAMVCVPTPEDLKLLPKKHQGQDLVATTSLLEPRHKDHHRKRVREAHREERRRRKVEKLKMKGGTEVKKEEEEEKKEVIRKEVPVPDVVVLKSDPPSDQTQMIVEQPSSHPVPSLALKQEVVDAPAKTSDGDLALGPAPQGEDQKQERLVLGLWPDPLPSVTSHCSRVTLGWVTQGDFSLASGCGEALGLVSVSGLLHALLTQPPDQRGLLLLRNPSSLQYRFAKITIEA